MSSAGPAMEAADSGARQSAYHHSTSTQHQHQHQHQQYSTAQTHRHSPANHSLTSHAHQSSPPQSSVPYLPQREAHERQFGDQPAMATATVLTQANSEHQPHSSYSSGYSQQAAGANTDNMISSSESRRQFDENDAPSRQSLPSISEVISGAKRDPYPHQLSGSSNMQSTSALPPPFPSVSRQYGEGDQRSSPQPLHGAASYASRQEPLPSFTSSPRPPPFSGRPSLPAVSDRRSSPGAKPDMSPRRLPSDSQKVHEAHAANGTYPPHPHASQQAPPPHHQQPAPPQAPYQGGQLPPGQMPFPGYSVSPHHSVPAHPGGPYDPRGPAGHPEEGDYASRARYDSASLNRHFESWSYQEALSRIANSSRTIYNFAEAYINSSPEQNHPQPIPDRLPTEREVGEMLSNIELMKRSLEQVRETVQVSIQNDRAREGAKAKASYEEDQDVAMYGDGIKPQYPMTEVKKRRGRAAPPGRCHSCNRIDTPEWRRGPDGARTLCNACGLHYAKLERKRQLEARSIRPKPEERS